MAYVLGRRPDEFGLIPDTDGFVTIKELLKALHEEPGWRHLRPAHLNELLITSSPAPIEIEGKQIRARDRSGLPLIKPAAHLPKLLYAAIRQRAYPVVHTKGLWPGSRPYVVLASQRAMALRLGQRLDNDPVILTVQVALSQAAGVHFQQYGDLLFMADSVPVGAFNGPALPKERTKPDKAQPAPDQVQPKTPGSYYPDLSPWQDQRKTKQRQRRLKEKERQKERRKAHRAKKRQRH